MNCRAASSLPGARLIISPTVQTEISEKEVSEKVARGGWPMVLLWVLFVLFIIIVVPLLTR
jgi:hypothetical protein